MGPATLVLVAAGRGYEVTSECLEVLLPRLQNNVPEITELFVHLDKLETQEIYALAQALKGNSQITSLWLRGIEGLENEHFSPLVETLVRLPLARLRLMSWLREDTFKTLAMWVPSVKTLIDFEIHGDSPSPNSIRALIKAINALPSLRSLELTCRGVQFEAMAVGYRRAGPKSLHFLLPDLKSELVHSLDFWYTCYLTPSDIELLSTAILNNAGLENIALHSVYEMPGFNRLVDALRSLALKSLTINGISAQHIEGFAEIISSSQATLKRIDLTIGGEPPAESMALLTRTICRVESLEFLTLRTPEWSIGR